MKIAPTLAALAGIAIVATTLQPVTATSVHAAGKCVLAGGTATMITEDLAKFMANAALKNSISGMGAKPAGAIKMTCKPETGLTTCLANQRACK